MKRESNMAEGGYDPETTNPFNPHGDDDDDTTPLVPHRDEGEGIGMKHRSFSKFPPPRTKTSTSTSGEHETSFIDEGTPSGKFVYTSMREQEKAEIESRIKRTLPNAKMSRFLSRIDEYDRVVVKLPRQGGKEYILIGSDGELVIDTKKLPTTLRDFLGNSVTEIANENIAKETEIKEKAEARVKELQEQRENAFPQDRERIDAEIEREQEVANEAERNIEREETRLSLRERIKAMFKKYGFTAFAVATAIGTVIGVIVSNLKAGLMKVAKGIGNGMKELGKKLGEILPGMIGAIASFIFRTAGEVIGFLAKNAWLLVVGLVLLAVEQFKKKSK